MSNINLYHLLPDPSDRVYTKMMRNYFKWHDFTDIMHNKNVNYIQIESSNNLNITENDYIIVSDIRTNPQHDTKYYENNIKLFNKDKRIIFLYESIIHNSHKWKYEFVIKNFKYIFTNAQKIAKKYESVYWIPTCNLQIEHPTYNTEKTKFCMVSPIFDLGLYAYKNGELPPRVKIIKDLCEKNDNIHVYGNEQWKNLVSSKNFIGKLPGEDNAGIYTQMDFSDKIKNKCQTMSDYKFVLVFENLFSDGYVTEKLVESLFSNNVVIYYGSTNIETIYPDLFDMGVINGHKYSLDEIIDLMNNMTDDEYYIRVKNISSFKNDLMIQNSSENVKKFVVDTVLSIIDKDYKYDKNESNFSLEHINWIIKK
jgi:hypothetical protein